ncbi:MAG: hypothetical protein IJD45_07565 [Clostridia bacterium]|nr:hypothetical protein [Clostridia bacterium]
MKKILALLLTVVLVAVMGVTVYAAPSAEAQGVISGMTVVDSNDDDVSFALKKIDGKVNKYFYNTLTELKTEKGDKSLKVVGHYDVEVEGEPEYPLTVTLKVLGISKTSSVYILAQKGKGVVVITPEIDGNKLTFTVDEEFEKLAVVTDGKTADKVEKENDVLSPQTADMSVYVAIAAFISLVAIAIIPKKIKD